MKQKILGIIITTITLIFIFPHFLIAGGDFKEKMQKKLNAPSNIKLQQEVDLESSDQYGNYNISSESSLDDQQKIMPEKEEKLRPDVGRKDVKAKGALRPGEQQAGHNPKVTTPSSEVEVSSILSSYVVYKTDYKAEIEEEVVTLNGKVIFEVFKKGWTQIPLVDTNVGLIDVSINKGTSFVIARGGKYYLILDKPGRYSLDMEYLIKASRERESGPGNFRFEVMPAPISQFEFIMPEEGVEIFIEPAIKVKVKKETKKTVAWAVMPNTNNITVRWTKALPKEVITPVKLEPKIFVDTATYASVGEGIIRCQTALNYSVLQSEVTNLRIALPEDVSVLEVQGRELRDWKIAHQDGQQYVDVYLNFGIKGNYILNLSYERKVGEGTVVAQVPALMSVGAEREKGYFGLSAATNVELAVNKLEHASLIDIKELPSSIWSGSTNPILLAFKYLAHPFNIAIDVTRHEELPVLVATIDSVEYVTLLTDEGKILTRAVYKVRNNVKQFVNLVLPNKATLWSVFVAGRPVKPAKDKTGNILIPLEKSQFRGEELTQFSVEIVYLDRSPKMELLGKIRLNLPKTDIPISQLNWSVYFPFNYWYFHFDGDVRKVKDTVGIVSAARLRRYGPKADYAWKGDQKSLEQQYVSPQADIGEGGSVFDQIQTGISKGVLPIRISIPQQGRLFRFSKLLVTEEESPWLSLNFITVFKQVHGFSQFLVIIGILFFVGIMIKKVINRKSKNE